MRLAKDGSFSISLGHEQLASGLRFNQSSPRNSTYMVELYGMIGKDKVLQTLDSLDRIPIASLGESFPFPQLFILSNHIYVCGETKIYEYIEGVLYLRVTASESGGTWRVLGFADYVCMSNGQVTITRDPLTNAWSESSDLPAFNAACDYNGQVLIGNVKS